MSGNFKRGEIIDMMKSKFYSEEIGKCLFDGPLDDCPYQDDHSKCNCFKPIKENKKESKNMKNHKSYSTHVCKYYYNDACHYSEKIFGSSPASCHCVNNFENGCICFEPPIGYEVEGKKESEVEKRFKENLDQIKSVKIYSTKPFGDLKECKYIRFARVIDNCLGNFIVIDCTNDKVYTYSHAEYSWKEVPRETSKTINAKLMTDIDTCMDPRTLTIQNCDKIILKPKNLEVEFKIEKDNFDDFDYIAINGHKFKKVK